MNVRGKDFALAAGTLLLLAVGLVRLAVPDRSRMRALSVEGMDIPSEPIPQGGAVTREASWSPPADVYVVGWNYHLGARQADPRLILLHGNTRLFSVTGLEWSLNPAFFQAGSGYRLQKGQHLTLRFSLTNAGAAGQTQGASVLVYFVPVEGN